MAGFDEVLSILENTTRRQILMLLVKEPHYPLQISELIENRVYQLVTLELILS